MITNAGQVVYRNLVDPSASFIMWSGAIPAQGSGPFTLALRPSGSLVVMGGAAAPLWSSQSECMGTGPFTLRVR